jgi:hypothetical protein
VLPARRVGGGSVDERGAGGGKALAPRAEETGPPAERRLLFGAGPLLSERDLVVARLLAAPNLLTNRASADHRPAHR